MRGLQWKQEKPSSLVLSHVQTDHREAQTDHREAHTWLAHDKISTHRHCKGTAPSLRAKAVMSAGPRAGDTVGTLAGIPGVASILEHRLTVSLHVYFVVVVV